MPTLAEAGVKGVDVYSWQAVVAPKGLPAAEVAVHPADPGGTHELFLMCDDVEAFVADTALAGMSLS